MSDGGIAVANSGTHEIRFYDAAGTFISSAGRKGGGPGEFEGILWFERFAADSLMAFDWRNRRVSIFDSRGTFARSFILQLFAEVAGFPNMVTPFSSDALFVGVQHMFLGGEIKSGLERESVLYVRCDMSGTLLDTIGVFPGGERWTKSSDDQIEVSTRAFGLYPQTAVRGDGFFYGSTDDYSIGYYTSDGVLERVIRADRTNLSVTASDIERYTDELLDNAADESERQFLQRLYADMPYPETMPAHGELLTDSEGNLWVAEYRRPGDEQPRWTIFDPDGAMLGVVETPSRFTVYEIGSDFVLGRWADDFDVEHIQVYELIRSR